MRHVIVLAVMMLLIAGACGSAGASDESPLVFSDTNLEAVVRKAIDKPAGDILPSDVEGMILLSASFKDIANLAGIERLTNLKNVNLMANQIGDISNIANLTNLEVLNLAINQISDISGIANLTNLTILYLAENQISDISSLANLTKLKRLEFGDNQISDISSLANLPDLHTVGLDNNQISDLSPLVTNTDFALNTDTGRMDVVRVNGNPLSDLAYSVQIPALVERGVEIFYDSPPIAPLRVEVSGGRTVPSRHSLSQNYPNPFNPETTIRYDVAKTGPVRLSVYALTGQLVRTLVDGERPAGNYSVTWNGTDDAGRGVASGMYLARMEAGGYSAVRKMLLVR